MKRKLWVTGIAAVLYALLVWTSAWQQSLVTDEVYHIPAGYSYLKTRDYRMNVEHPPLAKLLAAVPMLPFDPVLPLDHPTWAKAEDGKFGVAFFDANRDKLEAMVGWARLPIAMLAGLMVAVAGLWAWQLYGPWAGATAMVVLGATPEVLNHGRWVTTDLAIACFGLVTVFAAWHWLRDPRPWKAMALGLALGAAFGSKYSAVLLLPMLVLLGVAWRLARRPFPAIRDCGIAAVCLILGPYLVLSLCYASLQWPVVYWEGVRSVYVNHDPLYPFYLLGHFAYGKIPGYFLVAFLLKTPLPILLATLLGVVACFWPSREHQAPGERWIALAFLGSALGVFAFMEFKASNIGIRYVLPAMPFLALLIGRAVYVFGRRLVPLYAVLGLWAVGDAVRAWPDLNGAFSELATRPTIAHLDDANVNWTQGMIALRQAMRARGLNQVEVGGLMQFYPPSWYGVQGPSTQLDNQTGKLQPGWYAFDDNYLLRTPGFLWLAYLEPETRVNGISLYRISPDAVQVAMSIYRDLLETRPTSWVYLHYGAFVMGLPGAEQEALTAFSRSIELWPDNLVARYPRAYLYQKLGDEAASQQDQRFIQQFKTSRGVKP